MLKEGDSSDKQKIDGCNGIRTHNHLVCIRTLNFWAKLAKWLSYDVVHLIIQYNPGKSDTV